LPEAASVSNPVDIIASSGPQEYQACLEILCDDPDLDALLVIFIPPLATPTREVAQVLSDVLAARPNLQRPVAAVFFDPYSSVVAVPVSEKTGDARPKRSVPVYTFPESAAAALGAAARYGSWRAAPTGSVVDLPIDRDVVQRVLAANQSAEWLSQKDVVSLLGAAGIEILTAPMAKPGVELLAGVTHDPVFGPLVAFGSGGYLVELLDDFVFRVLPLTDRDAAEMIRSTRIYRLLKGYRGSPAADINAIEKLLLQLGELAEAVPQIAEIDLNPVIVHPKGEGVTLIDARVRLMNPVP
jgi:acyl-CoA synthetase (NDP forming)